VARTPLEAAAAALARRDRSAAGLAAYLEKRGIPADDAAAAVERLAELGYLNDERFALRRAEVLADRGCGDDAIRFDLEREGVDAATVEAAVAALAPERERATRVLGRAPSLEAGLRRLGAKGFAADTIEAVASNAAR
jgi:regulatory protein